MNDNTSFIRFNVDGEIFVFLKSTISSNKDSFFSPFLNPDWKGGVMVDGAYYIDRNPRLFPVIKMHLQGQNPDLSEFKPSDIHLLKQDADFYNLENLSQYIEQYEHHTLHAKLLDTLPPRFKEATRQWLLDEWESVSRQHVYTNLYAQGRNMYGVLIGDTYKLWDKYIHPKIKESPFGTNDNDNEAENEDEGENGVPDHPQVLNIKESIEDLSNNIQVVDMMDPTKHTIGEIVLNEFKSKRKAITNIDNATEYEIATSIIQLETFSTMIINERKRTEVAKTTKGIVDASLMVISKMYPEIISEPEVSEVEAQVGNLVNKGPIDPNKLQKFLICGILSHVLCIMAKNGGISYITKRRLQQEKTSMYSTYKTKLYMLGLRLHLKYLNTMNYITSLF